MIPGNPIKIVVVDDTSRSISAVRTLLLKGYDVEVASTGIAMSVILRHWPDIVTINSKGTSIKSTLKSMDTTKHMKVIEL